MNDYNEDAYNKDFIEDLRDDLDTLKEEEKFQRHVPEYYAEVCYYNEFHKRMPNKLFLTPCYKAFIGLYLFEGKSLFEAISAFIEEYDKGNNEAGI